MTRATNNSVWVLALVSAATCALAASAVADITSYDSRADFQAATSATAVIDFFFEGTPHEVSGDGHITYPGGFAVPLTNIEITGESDPMFLLGPDVYDGSIIDLPVDGSYNTPDQTTYLASGLVAEFTFHDDGVNVFGIDVFALLDPPGEILVEVNVQSVDDDTLFEDEFDLLNDDFEPLGFVGFISDQAIGTITFALAGPGVEGQNAIGFDNMTVEGAEVIPAPAAATLGLIGLAAVGLIHAGQSKRKRRSG